MNQWEIWTFDFADAGPHPALIVSHPDRVARAPFVNVLIGSSQRASRPARENEVLLNGADGLDWETLFKCDLMYLVEKERLYQRRGQVGSVRRRLLVQRLNACFGCSRWLDNRLARRHAMISLIALPAMPVRRTSRPWNFTLSRVCSMPSSRSAVAWKSWTSTGFSTAE